MFTSSAPTQPRNVQYIQVEGLTIGNGTTSASPAHGTSGKTLIAGHSGSQIRVLQTISSKPSQVPKIVNVGNSQQIPIQIVKQGSGNHMVIQSMVPVSSIKTPLASPAKVVKIPGARMVTKSPGGVSKLKVGDTIVIPKALNTINAASINSNSPVIINQQMNSPTPTKFIQAGSPISYRSTNNAGTQEITYIQPTTLTTSKVGPTWAVSPMRCKRPNEMADEGDIKRRRTPNGHEKGSKGLRHFAMLVCEKVKHKRTTTYNEVADELVSEYAATQRHNSDQQYDQKNIRRRVYDALNVLMAMNIIYKDKKDIHWVGLPTNSAHEMEQLEHDKQLKLQTIKDKKLQLQELILQQIAFKNLVQRNKRLLQTQGTPASNSAIQLPFIIVNTSKKTVIDCSISNDKYEYLFNFDNTFEIHDDIEVLKRMGMAYGLESGGCSQENLQTALSLVPPVLKPYVEEMAGCLNSNSSEKKVEQIIPMIKKEIITHEMVPQSNSNQLFLSQYQDNGTDVDDILLNNDSQTSGSALSSGSSLTLTGMSSQSSPDQSQEV